MCKRIPDLRNRSQTIARRPVADGGNNPLGTVARDRDTEGVARRVRNPSTAARSLGGCAARTAPPRYRGLAGRRIALRRRRLRARLLPAEALLALARRRAQECSISAVVLMGGALCNSVGLVHSARALLQEGGDE